MTGFPFARRRSVTVPCTVEVGITQESVHAFVRLDGVEAGPGDEVIVHGAPDRLGFGDVGVWHCTATVVRAGPLARLWSRIEGYLELTELYEVGFSTGRTA